MPGFSRRIAALAVAVAIPLCATQASADSERVFYTFTGHGAHDGDRPQGGVIADKYGNL